MTAILAHRHVGGNEVEDFRVPHRKLGTNTSPFVCWLRVACCLKHTIHIFALLYVFFRITLQVKETCSPARARTVFGSSTISGASGELMIVIISHKKVDDKDLD